eukprot:12428693-Karenia_brevis.AAC.1
MSALEGIRGARDIVHSYGDHGDSISEITKLGKHPQNGHRDFVGFAKCGLPLHTWDVRIVGRNIKDPWGDH